jgi:hypothetical protein
MPFLSVLSIIWKFIGTPFRMFGDLVKTNPKAAIFLVALVVALYGVWKVDHHIKDLETQTTVAQKAEAQAIEDKNKLQTQLDSVVQINTGNQEVIRQMQEDAKARTRQVQDLNASLLQNTKNYGDLISKINSLPKEADGPVAPVLAQTIDEIQKERGEK